MAPFDHRLTGAPPAPLSLGTDETAVDVSTGPGRSLAGLAAVAACRGGSGAPGTASSHCARVRIGIAFLSSDPGLVSERPAAHLRATFGEPAPGGRQIPHRRGQPLPGRLHPAPPSRIRNRSATIVLASYHGVRARRVSLTIVGLKALASARREWVAVKSRPHAQLVEDHTVAHFVRTPVPPRNCLVDRPPFAYRQIGQRGRTARLGVRTEGAAGCREGT